MIREFGRLQCTGRSQVWVAGAPRVGRLLPPGQSWADSYRFKSRASGRCQGRERAPARAVRREHPGATRAVAVHEWALGCGAAGTLARAPTRSPAPVYPARRTRAGRGEVKGAGSPHPPRLATVARPPSSRAGSRASRSLSRATAIAGNNSGESCRAKHPGSRSPPAEPRPLGQSRICRQLRGKSPRSPEFRESLPESAGRRVPTTMAPLGPTRAATHRCARR
jgi:hypothetical protein